MSQVILKYKAGHIQSFQTYTIYNILTEYSTKNKLYLLKYLTMFLLITLINNYVYIYIYIYIYKHGRRVIFERGCRIIG